MSTSGAMEWLDDVLGIRTMDLAFLAAWAATYTFLTTTDLLLPTQLRKDKRKRLEWHNRSVSTLHAVVMVIGSVVVYFETLQVPDHELIFGFAYTPDLCARIFRAYLIYDLVFSVAYFSLMRDVSSIIHHVLFLSVTTYCVKYSLMKYPFAWLAFGELSTPFVNLRWTLAASGKQSSSLYLVNGVLLTLSFFGARVVTYFAGLHHFFLVIGYVWLPGGDPGIYFVGAALVGGYLLNVYWFSLIARGLVKLLRKSKKTS